MKKNVYTTPVLYMELLNDEDILTLSTNGLFNLDDEVNKDSVIGWDSWI